MRNRKTHTRRPSSARFQRGAVQRRGMIKALTLLCACAGTPPRPSTPETSQSSSSPAPDADDSAVVSTPRDTRTPIDLDTLEVVSSGATIYMWGGLYIEPDLDAPVPLIPGILRPGDALTLVRVHCRVQGVGTAARVRCGAAGRTPTPTAGRSWHDRARACTQLDIREPSRAQVRAVQRPGQRARAIRCGLLDHAHRPGGARDPESRSRCPARRGRNGPHPARGHLHLRVAGTRDAHGRLRGR